jgi:uncharacterized membrane protein
MTMMGLVLMVLFWSGLIALAVWLVRALFPLTRQSRLHSANGEQNPGKILDQRYTQGEISQEEYDLMKETLAVEGRDNRS